VTTPGSVARVSDAIADRLKNLPKPERWFGSDNQSGAFPEVLEALAEANSGHAVAYGDDRWTAKCVETFRDLLGGERDVYLSWNGSGSNVVALQTLLPKFGAVICTDAAHIAVDETGAPERITGAKLIDVPTVDAKLTPDHIERQVHALGNPHHAQPAVVSITQSTELGTLYSVDEVAAICDAAHRHGMAVHMDGARIANATSALGVSLRAHTFDAGVDALSFGGTKNGLMNAEAVIFRNGQVSAPYLRKQATQLPSKMRFIAAQFLAAFEDDRWLRSAGHSNAMAAKLDALVRNVPGVTIERPTVVNSLFPMLPAAVLEPLQAWCPHYTWDATRNQARWVCSFDTTTDDVEKFAAGVAAACAVTTAG
jgi:threonine aldolase